VPPAAQRKAVRRTAPDLAVVRGNTNRHTTIGVLRRLAIQIWQFGIAALVPPAEAGCQGGSIG